MSTSESAQAIHLMSSCPIFASICPQDFRHRRPPPRNTARFTADCRSGILVTHLPPGPDGISRALAVMQLADNTFPTDLTSCKRFVQSEYVSANFGILSKKFGPNHGKFSLNTRASMTVRLPVMSQVLVTQAVGTQVCHNMSLLQVADP